MRVVMEELNDGSIRKLSFIQVQIQRSPMILVDDAKTIYWTMKFINEDRLL